MTNAISRAGSKPRRSIAVIMGELADFALKHNDEIVTRVMPRWISLKSKKVGKVFAEMRPSKERIQIFVLPPPMEFGNGSFAKRAPLSQGWGWFKSKFSVEDGTDTRRAVRLLRISYLSILKFKNRRG